VHEFLGGPDSTNDLDDAEASWRRSPWHDSPMRRLWWGALVFVGVVNAIDGLHFLGFGVPELYHPSVAARSREQRDD
jgi:hypothetical protein